MFSRGEIRLLGLASALFLAGLAWKAAQARLVLPPLEVQGEALRWESEPIREDSEALAPTPVKHHTSKSKSSAGSLNPNLASAEQLQTLPGIGPALAERIVKERAQAPFQSAEDLQRVKGIGPARLEKLRSHLNF